MNVRIVTDSTAHISPDLYQELRITVVPFHVQIGDRTYLDGVNLDEKEFYSLVCQQGLEARTQPPTVEEFYRVYQGLSQDSGQVISLHLSDVLSRTIDNARQAAAMLLGRCRITVIDSQSISLGLGILVEAAARAAAEGRSLDNIVRLVRKLIHEIYILFFSENLDYLERSGRIGRAHALLGGMLGIKPFLILEEGEILPLEKVRTRDEAIAKLIEFISEFDTIRRMAIVRGPYSRAEEIQTLVERVQVIFPGLQAPVIGYGPVLTAHIGLDTLGVVVHEQTQF